MYNNDSRSDNQFNAMSLLALATLAVLSAPSSAFAAGDEVTIDSNFSSAIAKQFHDAKTLALPVTISLDLATADAFEKIGHYSVTPDRQAGAQGNKLLDSEKRALLSKMCSSDKADIALLIDYVNSGNSGIGGALLGKVHVHYNWTLSYENCKNHKQDSFTGKFTYRQALLGVRGNSQISQDWANALVTALVQAAGRAT